MADALNIESGTNTLNQLVNLHSLPLKSKEVHLKTNRNKEEYTMDIYSYNFVDTVSVWSPPNTPPNKCPLPRLPSFSPSCASDADLKDSKITPPRGRPKAEMINHLIEEGTQSCSPIRCDICSRVFPREKSLQAHKRTHSGDRPYMCDFPNCKKAFVQSGQLKTHQRLHTGEKPFICTIEGCQSRFTHANRHCPIHPKAGLVRRDSDDIPLKKTLLSEIQNKEPNEHTKDVLLWLNKYERERQNKSPGSSKLSRKESKREMERVHERNQLSISEKRMARKEARKRMVEQKERWIGALALVELAELAANTMPNIHTSLNLFPHEHVEYI